MSDRRFCTYIHFRESDGKPFYVGKGKPSRALDFSNRSAWWKRIAKKHGVTVKVVLKDAPDPCCIALEKILIKKIGRKNLCNMTDGGDGASGMKQSENQKRIMRILNKDRTVPRWGIEKSVAKRIKPVGTTCGLRFVSITEAARFISRPNVSATASAIRASANAHNDKAYGYKWGYVIGGELIIKEYKKRVYKTIPVSCSNGMSFKGVPSAIEWLKIEGFSKACPSYLSEACRGLRKSAYGYRWRYV
jgi:hypothetical protein